MNDKGFVNLLVGLIVVVALAGAGYWYWQSQNEESTTPTKKPTATPTSDELETYTNTDYNFSFDYPEGLWSKSQIDDSLGITDQQTWKYLNLPTGANADVQGISIVIYETGEFGMELGEWLDYLENDLDPRNANDFATNLTKTNLNGNDVIRFESRPVLKEWEIYTTYYLFPKLDNNYVLSVRVDGTEENNEVFQTIINSLSF